MDSVRSKTIFKTDFLDSRNIHFLYAVAFLLIMPGLMTDIIGFVLFILILTRQWFSRKRMPAPGLEKQAQPLGQERSALHF